MRRGIGLRRKAIAVGLFEAGSSAIPLPSLTSPVAAWSVHEDDIANVYQDSAKTTPVASDGDVIGAVVQLAGFGAVDATQTTTANKPLLRTLANGINNHNAALFDGSNDFWNITGVTAASGAKTVYVVTKPTSAVATLQYFFDAQTGRFILAHLTNTSKLAYNDGSGFVVNATPTTNNQILSFVLGSGTGTIYRDGASLGSAAYVNQALGGASAIGSVNNGISAFFAGLIGAIYIYNAEHSTAERESMEAHLASKWGITLA